MSTHPDRNDTTNVSNRDAERPDLRERLIDALLGNDNVWTGDFDATGRDCERIADAVLAVLAEPTEEMIRSGARALAARTAASPGVVQFNERDAHILADTVLRATIGGDPHGEGAALGPWEKPSR